MHAETPHHKLPRILFWSINTFLFLGISFLLFYVDLVYTFYSFESPNPNPVNAHLITVTFIASPIFWIVNFLANRFLKSGFSNRAILILSAAIPLLSYLLFMLIFEYLMHL